MQKPSTMNFSKPRWSISASWSSVWESQGRSISSGPEDWPGGALRKSKAMQRYSLPNSFMALNGG